ncbi:hypothetical protein AMS68_000116 [Peltaster fructicola]|uniref:COP9 signalosome complex subunit 5 n=1 Tax=Peltaster fructicola TaxID=286661 RepID=A0A6H0XIY7_9PEZI|nr:hypothetical protein AMS68_000116 [Peltaster fructicola]
MRIHMIQPASRAAEIPSMDEYTSTLYHLGSTQLYTSVFDADLELENYVFAGAPYSGARSTGMKERYHPIGIQWSKGTIKGLGWSVDERLIVVAEDGTVHSYTGLQEDFTPFSLGHGSEEYGVKSCCFWHTGFVALLGDNTLVAITRYDEPRPQQLATTPAGDVASFAVIPPEYTSSRSVEVVLAINKSVCIVDAAECEDRGLDSGPYQHVWVISSDFQDRLTEYDSKVATPPRLMLWCGNNAVVLAWEDEIHLIGPNGAATKYYYDSFVHIVGDIDGIRLYTNDICEFMQKVPDETEDIFRPASSTPGAILLDATEQLEERSPRADDNIQMIRNKLDEAVDACIRAAGHEYDTPRQKKLLKAASFGKSVLDLYNSDDFVDMTEALRVLNAVRYFKIGMPLSYEQYIRLTPERLIQRLINRQEYLLALKICKYLFLPEDRVCVHWARRKVRSSGATEDGIAGEIVQKLSGKRGISFEEVARAAFDEGREKLAISLLEHEVRAGKQVPLLLESGEQTVALDKATQSGDTDLILRVLLEMKRKLPLATFFRSINNKPLATAVVEMSAMDQDVELLKDLYYQDDRRLDGSNLLVSEALTAGELVPTIDKLKMASRLLKDSKEFTHQATAIDDEQKLLRTQEVFEKEIEESFKGLSINETLAKLIEDGHIKRAQKVASDFKINDKTFWWVRLRALITRRDWPALEALSKERKSPIGWEPFFNDILGAGNPKVASMYITKCAGLAVAERVDMWVKCGMITKAGEEALRAKDRSLMEQLRAKADGASALDIDRMLAQLNKEADNSVKLVDPKRDALYSYDAAEIKKHVEGRPWKNDPRYFKHVRISAIALIKMVMHARSGGSLEVMGIMLGYIQHDTFIVTDAVRLPVEGTETRVNAGAEADEYLIQFLDRSRQAGQLENAVGWYHSHPGYGCWLSGIDVGTEHTYQMHTDPFVAVVIDPDRTISAGKVEIGAFRTYPEGYKPEASLSSSDSTAVIPENKASDFGAHAHRYYSLEVSHFKSSLDSKLLEGLWNKYWVQTLSASPLESNREYGTRQIQDLAEKIEKAQENAKHRGGIGPMLPREKKHAEAATQTLATSATRIANEEKMGLMAALVKDRVFSATEKPSTETNGQEIQMVDAKTS